MSEYGLNMIDLVLTHLDHHWGYPWWFGTLKSTPVAIWPFPKCLKMVTFCEIGHFGKEASNPKMQEKKHVKKWEPICKMTFFYLTSHSNLCLIFKKIHDMPIQQIGSNFCPNNHQLQKYGSSVQVYSPELMNEWIHTLGHGFNFWEVNVWVKKVRVKIKKIKYIHSSPDFRRENNNFLPSQWILLQWKLNFRRKSVCWEKWWPWKRKWKRRRRRWRQR